MISSSVLFCVLVLRTQLLLFFFFFNDPAPTEIYTLSLHDALPICRRRRRPRAGAGRADHPRRRRPRAAKGRPRSEEHTSELQSRGHLVCRLLLEKKKMTMADLTLVLSLNYCPLLLAYSVALSIQFA